MKSFNTYKTLINRLILGAAIFIIAACSPLMGPDSEDNTQTEDTKEHGTLEIEILTGSTAKTILPSISGQVADYLIQFSPQDGQQNISDATTSNANYTQTELEPGTWNVSVSARNSNGDAIASGSKTGISVSNSTTSVSVELSPSQSGSGSLDITIDWSSTNVTSIDTVTETLETLDGNSKSIDFSAPSSQKTSYNGSLASGSYRLWVELKAGDTLYTTVTEAVQIYDNAATSSTITLESGDFTSAPSAPSEINTSEVAGGVRITWADNSNIETGFTVERSTTSGSGFSELSTVSHNTTSYDDTPTNENTTYYYKIKATNSFGSSGYTSETSGKWVSPSGYSVSIDQTAINQDNQTALSFTFSGAETGTTYDYSIDDESNTNTDPVTGSGSVSSSDEQITGIDVSSLNNGTLTLEVTLTDEAGNTGSSASDTVTKDTGTPTPGNSGNLSTSNVTFSSVDVSWTKASDNVTAEADLQYKLVYSTSYNIETVSDAENNGTIAEDWTTDIASATVDNLSDGTTYYFNVLVKDEAGNINTYTTTNAQTTDVTAPTPGDSGSLSATSTTDKHTSTIDVSWTEASDNTSDQSALQYKLVYSTSNNIGTVSNAQDNGTIAKDWTTDIATASITGLESGTEYYFNVLVMDEAGNKAVYQQSSKITQSAWQYKGTDGDSFSAGLIISPDIEFDSNDNPYVVYQDNNDTNGGATAKKYENGTDSWETLGSAGFTADYASDVQMAISSANIPYVVYCDGNSDGEATVQKYDSGTGNWSVVGSAGFSSTGTGTGVSYTDIALNSSDIPYVAYQYGYQGGITVKKYDGSSWITVGTAEFSAGQATGKISINSNNVPFVAYMDYANNYGITVKKYDGNSWVTVGTERFSDGDVSYCSIAFHSSDTPYVAYNDIANDERATVQKFNGSSWELVGSKGFTQINIDYPVLAINSSDIPHILFQQNYSNYNNKAAVMRFK